MCKTYVHASHMYYCPQTFPIVTSCTQHSLGEGGAGWQVRCRCDT